MTIRFEQINQWSEVIQIYRWAPLAQNLFSLKINDISMKISSLKYFISVTRTSFQIRYLMHDAIFHSFFKIILLFFSLKWHRQLNVINIMKTFKIAVVISEVIFIERFNE